MTSAKIIEDSITVGGKSLTTMQLTYPRYIHAEFMTHRVFSRNASSSRAVPVAKMVELALTNIVEPIRWGHNQPGMQAMDGDLVGADLRKAQGIWRDMADSCAQGASKLAELGLHKQWANRPLEWFSNISVVVTATEWENFYSLRDHEDAQPEIRHLAVLMKEAKDASTPYRLEPGEWHLPYVTDEEDCKDVLDVPEYALQMVSAARCARVSYMTHDGKRPDVKTDLALFDRLAAMRPLHASPLEHQATPGDTDTGNFVGWTQFRKLWEKSL